MSITDRPKTAGITTSPGKLISNTGTRLYGRKSVLGPEMRSKLESTTDWQTKRDILDRYDQQYNARELIKQGKHVQVTEKQYSDAEIIQNVGPKTFRILQKASNESNRGQQMTKQAKKFQNILKHMDQVSSKPIFQKKQKSMPSLRTRKLQNQPITAIPSRAISPFEKRAMTPRTKLHLRSINKILSDSEQITHSKSQKQYLGRVMKQMKQVYAEKMKEIKKGLHRFNSSSLVIEEDFIHNYSQWDPYRGEMSKERWRAERQAARQRKRLIS